MVFEVNKKSVIGYKKLSSADLGFGSSHQTHIGLFEGTFDFFEQYKSDGFAYIIYNSTNIETLFFLDPIIGPSGPRSPKIRKGSKKEKSILGNDLSSVVDEVRNITQSNKENERYLMRFGLENNDLIFLLFQKGDKVYKDVNDILGKIENKGVIKRDEESFAKIVDYLDMSIEESSEPYYEELELIGQDLLEITVSKRRKKYSRFDIEKAKETFGSIGKEGETFINEMFAKQQSQGIIDGYIWENQHSESGLPYDFKIKFANGKEYFTDVKSTTLKFGQKMFFSNSEFEFMTSNNNYLVHRVFNLRKNPEVKVCDNLSDFAKDTLIHVNDTSTNLLKYGISLNRVNFGVDPTFAGFRYQDF